MLHRAGGHPRCPTGRHRGADRGRDLLGEQCDDSGVITVMRNVSTPSWSANTTSWSTQESAEPPGTPTLSRRRTSLGSRPAPSAASSMMALPRARSPSLRYPSEGSQPSALVPMSRSIRGLSAPSQMGMSWAGAGPRRAPTTRWCSPSTRSIRPASVAHMPRITSMPSLSASTDCPGVRWGPPIASMASQKTPAPSASAVLPADRRSSDAAALASTAGGRSGRFRTLPLTVTREVRAATQLRSVQVSRKPGL